MLEQHQFEYSDFLKAWILVCLVFHWNCIPLENSGGFSWSAGGLQGVNVGGGGGVFTLPFPFYSPWPSVLLSCVCLHSSQLISVCLIPGGGCKDHPTQTQQPAPLLSSPSCKGDFNITITGRRQRTCRYMLNRFEGEAVTPSWLAAGWRRPAVKLYRSWTVSLAFLESIIPGPQTLLDHILNQTWN